MRPAGSSARRVDPRRPASIGPSGLRRIVLGGSEGDRTAATLAPAPTASKPLRSAGPFARCVLVVAHADRGALDDHAREVVAAAAVLAESDCEVVVAVLGACQDDAATWGIDRMLVHSAFDPEAYQPDVSVCWMLELQRLFNPAQWLLADRGADGDLGRRFSVAAGLSVACHVVELSRGQLRVRAAGGFDALAQPTAVMLLERGVARAALPFVGLGRQGTPPAWPQTPPAAGVDDLGLQAGDPELQSLEEADLILAAGNGVTDVALFNALASALGAATGASRVAVDDGRFPRAKQIGATGKTVSASGYLALGISGAMQHLQGIKDCRHVIAVNRDAAAPIARRAALTVVEDSGTLMRALLDQVRQQRGRA
jgi:electron transfer flavoprotein alpha subunit